jgi:hypothetical protein
LQGNVTFIFNKSAFAHDIAEADIRNAFSTFVFDGAIENTENKFLVMGFDTNGNLLEVMYNIIGGNAINIFHAMKCRKEFIKLIKR